MFMGTKKKAHLSWILVVLALEIPDIRQLNQRNKIVAGKSGSFGKEVVPP